MTTPSYRELVAALRREGEGLAAAGRLGLDPPVAGCPRWTVGDLLVHVGRVYRYAAEIVESRATEQPAFPPRPDTGEDPVEYVVDGLDEVVTALAEAEPDSPAWNWSTQSQVAAFWARRMTHESLVHRYDAEQAHDVAHVVDVDLAVDAIDEAFDPVVPRLLARAPIDGLHGSLHLAAIDAGAEWTVKLAPDSLAVIRGPGSGDVEVRGKALELLLLLYNRGDRSAHDVSGDPTVLDRWAQVRI